MSQQLHFGDVRYDPPWAANFQTYFDQTRVLTTNIFFSQFGSSIQRASVHCLFSGKYSRHSTVQTPAYWSPTSRLTGSQRGNVKIFAIPHYWDEGRPSFPLNLLMMNAKGVDSAAKFRILRSKPHCRPCGISHATDETSRRLRGFQPACSHPLPTRMNTSGVTRLHRSTALGDALEMPPTQMVLKAILRRHRGAKNAVVDNTGIPECKSPSRKMN